jgi:hypothetical protein
MVLPDPARRHARYAFRQKLFEFDSRSVVNIFHAGDWTAGGHNFAMVTWAAGGTLMIAQRPERWVSPQRRGTMPGLPPPYSPSSSPNPVRARARAAIPCVVA